MTPLLRSTLALVAALLLLPASAVSLHVRVQQSSQETREAHAEIAPRNAKMSATAMTTMSIAAASRNLSAAAKYAACPELRTLTTGCLNLTSSSSSDDDDSGVSCVVGGQWREVAAIADADIKKLRNATATSALLCTNAFADSSWTTTMATTTVDASGLRIEAVEAFPSAWITLDLSNNLLTALDVSSAVFEERIGGETVASASQLQTLSLANNRIASLANVFSTGSLTTLNMSGNPLQTLVLESGMHDTLRVLDAGNASLVLVNISADMYLEGLRVPYNQLSAFANISLPDTIYSLDVSFNMLTNWTSFKAPKKLASLIASDNGITELAPMNFSVIDKLVTVDLSFNKLQSIGGILWHRSLEKLDLRNNSITKFEIQRSDLKIFKNLTDFRVAPFESEACAKSKGELQAVGKRGEVKICVIEDEDFLRKYGYQVPPSTSNWLLIVITVASCVALLLLALVLLRHFLRQKNSFNIELTRDAVLCDASWIDDDQALAALRLEVSDLRIEKTICKGKLAVVYLAHMVDEPVAVKKIQIDKAKDAHAFAGLLAEIRLRSRLEHPKVVKFVGYCWASMADLALVTEFMANGNLSTLLKKQQQQQHKALGFGRSSAAAEPWDWYNGTAELPAKALFAIDIAEALVYLHTLAEPIVHGNIQSQSVLLSHEWEAKLAGFRLEETTPQISELITTGAPAAVAWMAPEILKHEAHGPSADIYAFGMLLAELDACANPFASAGLSKAQIALAVASGELKPVFGAECPAEIVEIATACLSTAAADRPTAMKLHYDMRQMVRASLAHV